MKNATRLTVLITLALAIATTALATHSVSPGAPDRLAVVNDPCPTFSWGAMDETVAFELVAYALPENALQQPELSPDHEVLFTRVSGTATSWTPSSDQCFAPGGRYVWFVRAVTEMIDDQTLEADEWSAGRYFEVPAGPTEAEVARAVEVLKQWEAMNGGGSQTLFAATAAASDAGTDADEDAGSAAPKSVPAASAAIRGEHPGTTGEVYGLVGTSASAQGAGIAAANLNSGPDLVLDGSVDGETDTLIWEWGLDKASPLNETFSMSNSGAGRLHLSVDGDVAADVLRTEEVVVTGVTVIDDAREWQGAGSTVPCAACVTSSDIADGTVGNAELADGSVTAEKIYEFEIGSLQLAPGAVTSNKIAAGAVTQSKVAALTITSDHVVNGAIATEDLANFAVTGEKLANDAVTGRTIVDGQISGPDIANYAIRSMHLVDGHVGTAKLADGAVTSAKIDLSQVTEAHLIQQAVTTSKIADHSVIASKLGTGSVTSLKIVDGAVNTTHVENGSLTAEDVNPSGGIYAGKSGIYSNADSVFLYYGGSAWVEAECDDENDLPLSFDYLSTYPGGGGIVSADEEVVVQGCVASHWDSLYAPSKVECSFRNNDPTPLVFWARIFCVEVAGP